MHTEVWTFKTARFTVALEIEERPDYEYDGDDPDNIIHAGLNSGEFVAFDSRVIVYLDGKPVGFDYLGGSVYQSHDVADFWQAHRNSPADQRNTLAVKARGVCVCHYFPGMVAEAIRVARITLSDIPKLRATP